MVLKKKQKKHLDTGLVGGREGNLWVALAEGSALGCYDPSTGELKRKVSMQHPWSTL